MRRIVDRYYNPETLGEYDPSYTSLSEMSIEDQLAWLSKQKHLLVRYKEDEPAMFAKVIEKYGQEAIDAILNQVE